MRNLIIVALVIYIVYSWWVAVSSMWFFIKETEKLENNFNTPECLKAINWMKKHQTITALMIFIAWPIFMIVTDIVSKKK